ncbi:phosphatidylglycerophosphatase A [candidate division WOR-3 bacterium]|uniref:Phosphatidylglycerophosphatase A n=1 Tax=candidate division WOR-3 bacterium TaxID=2052148 RepID=A0A9D5K9U7_UNCW3|nr:phosphatidylglycerophosphatase A [candidate division WOR-3 bacterium]MBD3363921.1 phosphatidylglycerophosphatase A [candidate division WOR-3 bacterium]
MKRPNLALRLGLSVFGTGYIPKGGGTLASLVALPLVWFLGTHPLILASVIIVISLLGVWGSFHAHRCGWEHDDKRITLDEFAGMLLALLWLPMPESIWGRLIIFALGFGIFRMLDILKPPPIKSIERLPGGWGVMLDDLAAGLIANGILRIIALIPIPLIYGY